MLNAQFLIFHNSRCSWTALKPYHMQNWHHDLAILVENLKGVKLVNRLVHLFQALEFLLYLLLFRKSGPSYATNTKSPVNNITGSSLWSIGQKKTDTSEYALSVYNSNFRLPTLKHLRLYVNVWEFIFSFRSAFGWKVHFCSVKAANSLDPARKSACMCVSKIWVISYCSALALQCRCRHPFRVDYRRYTCF
jgi:hypothetical protein